MKSICSFELKLDYENYPNELDMLGYVLEEDKVYLRLGRHYEFCIHADFSVNSVKNVQLLGTNSELNKFAKIKITNLDTNEYRVINPTRLVEFQPGDYKIDYGIWIDSNNETYTTPSCTFLDCPDVTYIQVDPIVTNINRLFAVYCVNLTGIMFGNPDLYPETQVFTQPYSHNDVILDGELSFTENTSGGFLRGNNSIGNIYIGDLVTGFTGCFGSVNYCMVKVNGKACRTYSDIKSEIYLGDLVSNSVQFPSLNKIKKCIISPNNQLIEYDPVVNGIVRKELVNGKKVILAGLGTGYPNGYLKIPSGYNVKNYTTYSGLDEIKVIDLSEYDTEVRCDDGVTGIKFDGFRDTAAETLILPYNVHFIPKFVAGFLNVKNLVVPSTLAPIVSWGGDYSPWHGTRDSVYDYCFNLYTNCYGSIGQSVSDKSNRNLYVLDGTSDEKNSWVEKYDRTQLSAWKKTEEGAEGYDRPNMWSDLLKDFNDEDTDHIKWPTESKSPYRAYNINYLSQQEMGELILSLNPNN